MVPIAITVAGLDPDIEPKNKHANTVAAPKPPGSQPIKARASSISLSHSPPIRINSAARMKNGTDIRAKLFIPENIRIGTTRGSTAPKVYSAAVTASASAAKIGKPNNSKLKKIGIRAEIIFGSLRAGSRYERLIVLTCKQGL